MDSITHALCRRLHDRAALGLNKYGTTLADAPLTVAQVLRHAQEEALDLAAYLERLLQEMGE